MALKFIMGEDLTSEERMFFLKVDLRQKIRRVIELGLTLKEVKQVIKEELK